MTGPSSRVPVLLVLVWVGGLLVATSVGLLAVRLVAAQVGDPAVAPLSAVAAASGAATPSGAPRSAGPPVTPTGAPPSGTAAPSAPPATTSPPSAPPATVSAQTFAVTAGTLGVQCAGSTLRLLYATPAQGYAIDERSVGGAEAEVRFRGAGTRVRLRLSCATGVPRLVEQRTDEDGGGGDDDRPDEDRPDDDRPDDDSGGGGDDGGGDDD